jgi:hypothetical protein
MFLYCTGGLVLDLANTLVIIIAKYLNSGIGKVPLESSIIRIFPLVECMAGQVVSRNVGALEPLA